jgi:hypothetical protein
MSICGMLYWNLKEIIGRTNKKLHTHTKENFVPNSSFGI